MKKTYYELLNIQPTATTKEVQAVFRRLAARYRPTLTVEQVFTDAHFHDYVNAYLTLLGESRATYDTTLTAKGIPPKPLDTLTAREHGMLMARIAFWRREMLGAMHQLRLLVHDEPGYAPAWALLGEVYLTVGRISDGVKSYERAVHAAPDDKTYAARLKHAINVEAGTVELQLELSPEEELRREERIKRWRFTALIALLGVAALVDALVIPLKASSMGFLNLPWRQLILDIAGVALLMAALGFGRILEPYERVMLLSSVSAGDRGFRRSYPRGMLLFVLAVASLWLAVVGYIVMALTDEETSSSIAALLGTAILANVGLTISMFLGHLPWGNAAIFGGNLVLIGGMVGWWVGSFGAPRYE